MAKTPRTLALLAGALALGTGSVLWGADEAPKPELVSGASAEMLADTCAGCHGTDGLSMGPASPTIAGTYPEYFVEVMQGFRDGKVYSTIMGRIAKGYSDEELKLMAGYFGGKPFKAADQAFDEKLAEKGAKLHDKFCEKCHSDGGKIVKGEAGDKGKGKGKEEEDEDEGGGEEYYLLAGQWTPYLHNTMEDFLADRREMPKKMKSKLKDLMTKEGDAGLPAIFAFYASQK
jgi:cytochrome subunit of sulfide dehydrogenase